MRKMHGSTVAMVAMAAAVVAGAACSGGSGGSAPKFGDTECAACIQMACTTEIGACNAIGDCMDALECVLDCPVDENALDTVCANDCGSLVTTSAGGTAFDGVIACYFSASPTGGTCEAQCAPPTE